MVRPVDNLPERGKLALVNELSMHIGGCAANASIDMARLGTKAAILGRIGADGFGSFLSAALEHEGVNTKGLKISETPSSASVVSIGSDAERSILHCLGANGEFCYEDIDQSIVAESGIVFIAGTFLMPSFDGIGTTALLQDAKSKGAFCCMDTAWDASGKWMKKIEGCLELLDWFMPSYEEAVELSGEKEPERIAAVFARKGAANVVIKLGAEGCYVKPAEGKGFSVASYTGIPVVDTSGAGDAFCAGFLTGLSKGWDPCRCAKLANAVGAHCIMAVGTTMGIRPLPEILAFMDNKESK
jgi:sugar/nucleoside kinase (ribokinase family)